VGEPSWWVQLIQWIPAGVIGAAAVAYSFRAYEAWQARQRELKGLLRLLAVEIAYNEQVFKHLEEYPEATGQLAEGAGLQTRAWEENRARIAELIKDSDDLQHFADYFMNVAVVEKERLVGQEKVESMWLHFPEIRKQGEEALESVIRVVGANVSPQVGTALEPPRDEG
jgi:hypothetical protein